MSISDSVSHFRNNPVLDSRLRCKIQEVEEPENLSCQSASLYVKGPYKFPYFR